MANGSHERAAHVSRNRRSRPGGPTNVNPPSQWEIYPEITGPEHAASDHAAIYVDLNI